MIRCMLNTDFLAEVLTLQMSLIRAGRAFITDSSLKGPNGIIIVDLDTGKSRRRLHDHPSTKAEKNFLPIVEGRPLMDRPKPGERDVHDVGSDGIAIGHDGKHLYYCPLASRHLYRVPTEALLDEKPSDERARASGGGPRRPRIRV